MSHFQYGKDIKGMEMVLDNGIYYEFVPFNNENFDDEGNLLDNSKAITIGEVEEGN